MDWEELDEPWKEVVRKNLELAEGKTPTPSQLAKLKKTKSFSVRGRKIKTLEPIRELTELDLLEIVDTSISDLSPLTKMKKLRNLYIRLSKKVTDLSPLDELPRLSLVQIHSTGVKAKDAKMFEAKHPDCTVDTGR